MRRRYDPSSRLLLTPDDPQAADRVGRLAELGLGPGAPGGATTSAGCDAFDAFARRMATELSAPLAMVNFIDERRQFLVGLHPTGGGGPPGGRGAAESERDVPGRSLPRSHGYCPHVVVRRAALVLEDVLDYPRFAGNPAVEELGIRAYLGAPLLEAAGPALGTVCVADVRPRPWGRGGLETIKEFAAELTARITAPRVWAQGPVLTPGRRRTAP
ncbi:GAF domain-containing protein [Streptomyces spiramenti]|uniref:GAF domain-containing protein n=1 Tax=Streptomyces spiramenti TaxID=2720606 RepID=A0ABX1AC36_9ACTN|nr:GAF domain-containing protein [Streptomyces spiramenti]NJP64763.1 GAF domain-containing protein [Streptomyces spiramenti]